MSDTPISDRFEVDNTQVLMLLAGPQSSLLQEVARQSGAEVSLRGNVIHFLGFGARRATGASLLGPTQQSSWARASRSTRTTW